MRIHEIKRDTRLRYKKTRVGRGGKRGTTSGHGTKGQKSRAGHRIRPAERDFIQRLPKMRGTTNKVKMDHVQGINLDMIEKYMKGVIINRKTLTESNLVKTSDGDIKILGNGEIKKAITVQNIPVSKSAKEKIERAGGKIETVKHE